MTQLSKNGAGVVVFLLSTIGIEVAESDVVATLAAVAQLVSFVLVIVNQYQRTDTKWFIFKK